MRETAATVPGKEKVAKQLAGELAVREKGIIAADTAAQAQAQLLQIIRRAGKEDGIDVRGAEEMKVLPLADDYGEVVVEVSFTCRIEQFVNFMAALANRPELISTSNIRVMTGDPKQKTVNVRLGLSGVVPRKLVPAKEGAGHAVKRKLLWANVALLAISAAVAVHVRREWSETRARQQAVLSKRVRPLPPPPVAPVPVVEPVKAAGYSDIAQKMLFSKDRNPVVVVEPRGLQTRPHAGPAAVSRRDRFGRRSHRHPERRS